MLNFQAEIFVEGLFNKIHKNDLQLGKKLLKHISLEGLFRLVPYFAEDCNLNEMIISKDNRFAIGM